MYLYYLVFFVNAKSILKLVVLSFSSQDIAIQMKPLTKGMQTSDGFIHILSVVKYLSLTSVCSEQLMR